MLKGKTMDDKIAAIMGMLRGKCDARTYMDVYLYANDGHYDEWSAQTLVTSLEYRNGSPVDVGLTPQNARELASAKATEMGLALDISGWDAYAEIAKAMAIHWNSYGGELDTAVTMAVEHMATE